MKTTAQPYQTEIRIPTSSKKRRKLTTLVLSDRLPRSSALALLVARPALVNGQDHSTEWVEPSAFDQLWGHATLYKDELNPILEEFKLRGRYQGQYWSVDDANGSQSNWEDRRSRFGFDAKLFNKQLEARLDFQSHDGFDDFYDGLVDAYLRWKPKSWLTLTAGKTKPSL